MNTEGISSHNPRSSTASVSASAAPSDGRRPSGGLIRPPGKESVKKYVSRRIVDAVPFQFVVVTLTLYALFGDGVRLLATSKESDPVFSVLTIISMVVFFVEIVLQCIGKDDYFLGFFFWLDLLSTVSLVFDVPEVNEALFAESGEEEGNALRAGRAGRAGTRASRVVRLIRLIRIVKVYQQMQMQKAKQRAKEQMKKDGVDDDSWLLDADEEDENSVQDSTAVGKKLTELTTQKLIVLILVMLLTLPYLDAATSLLEQPFSGHYGADRVYASLMRSLKTGANRTFERRSYEESLLMYIHFHNWYSEMPEPFPEACNGCSGAFDYWGSFLFWVGFIGEERDMMADEAYIQEIDPASWFREYSGEIAYRLHPLMPGQALEALKKPWRRNCKLNVLGGLRGISLLEQEGLMCPEDLRFNERKVVMPNLGDKGSRGHKMIFIMDMRDFSHNEAQLDIFKILFIVVILALGSMMFNRDSTTLVLRPLEQMIDKVEKIRANPLYATKMGDMEFKQEEMKKFREQTTYGGSVGLVGRVKGMFGQSPKKPAKPSNGNQGTPMETVLLEKTIIKLGTLLALGFGQAGANIIGQNMKGSDTAGVNAMIPGQRANCVIGVVCLQDFNVLTEVLQGNVMTFVNSVCEIIHGIVEEYHGAPNKNFGDTFLLIWRCIESSVTAGATNGRRASNVGSSEPASPSSPGARKARAITVASVASNAGGTSTTGVHDEIQVLDEFRLAEMSVVSMIKILAFVQRSPVLAEYRIHPGLLQKIQNYQVSIAVALHYGWAIEGAIGSEFKIDASYVSPNVNIAMRLVEATQQYAVKTMITESVSELLGPNMRRHFRHIDRVTVPGSKDPINLHTVDLDLQALHLEEPLQMEGVQWNQRKRFKARQAFEAAKQFKLKGGVQMGLLLDGSPDFVAMREKFPQSFFEKFRMAFFNYIAGEWKIALNMLNENSGSSDHPDGPSMALQEFMQAHGCQCPSDWQGFRSLSMTRPTTAEKSQLKKPVTGPPSPELKSIEPPAAKELSSSSKQVAPIATPDDTTTSKGSPSKGDTSEVIPARWRDPAEAQAASSRRDPNGASSSSPSKPNGSLQNGDGHKAELNHLVCCSSSGVQMSSCTSKICMEAVTRPPPVANHNLAEERRQSRQSNNSSLLPALPPSSKR